VNGLPTDSTPGKITPEPGMRFLHRHQVSTDPAASEPRPETCQVTAVRHGVIYYRNSRGARFLTAAEAFPACLLQWLPAADPVAGAGPSLPDRDDFERRMAALAPWAAGPGGVRECVFAARASFQHAARHGSSAACALHWLEEAERCAGLDQVRAQGPPVSRPQQSRHHRQNQPWLPACQETSSSGQGQ
jgi:hypothetical protein